MATTLPDAAALAAMEETAAPAGKRGDALQRRYRGKHRRAGAPYSEPPGRDDVSRRNQAFSPLSRASAEDLQK